MSVNPNQSYGANKYSINLLQPELLPEKVLLTLPRVVTAWCLVLLVMVGWVALTDYNQQDLKKRLTALQQENNRHTKQLETFTAQLSARKVDSQLAGRLSTIKILMGVKQAPIKEIKVLLPISSEGFFARKLAESSHLPVTLLALPEAYQGHREYAAAIGATMYNAKMIEQAQEVINVS